MLDVSLAILSATFRLWTPLALAAMGGVLSERAGVVNIALEAMMLAGCFASVAATQATGSVLVGVLAGIIAGAFVGLLHAVFTQKLHVAHILSGVGLNLGLLGFTTYAVRLYPGGALDTSATIPDWVTTLLAFLAVGLLFFVFAKTPLGLRLRAVGENPAAARSAGVNVGALRYGAVIVSGALAGLGGVALALAGLGAFRQNMTAGRGYIALAAVIFGRWHPLGAALAALFFAFGTALQQAFQTLGVKVPPDFLDLLPYALTLVALAFMGSKNAAPAALGNDDAA